MRHGRHAERVHAVGGRDGRRAARRETGRRARRRRCSPARRWGPPSSRMRRRSSDTGGRIGHVDLRTPRPALRTPGPGPRSSAAAQVGGEHERRRPGERGASARPIPEPAPVTSTRVPVRSAAAHSAGRVHAARRACPRRTATGRPEPVPLEFGAPHAVGDREDDQGDERGRDDGGTRRTAAPHPPDRDPRDRGKQRLVVGQVPPERDARPPRAEGDATASADPGGSRRRTAGRRSMRASRCDCGTQRPRALRPAAVENSIAKNIGGDVGEQDVERHVVAEPRDGRPRREHGRVPAAPQMHLVLELAGHRLVRQRGLETIAVPHERNLLPGVLGREPSPRDFTLRRTGPARHRDGHVPRPAVRARAGASGVSWPPRVTWPRAG